MNSKKPLEEVSKFLETFPTNIDRPKTVEQTSDPFLKDFLQKVLVHNLNLKQSLTK